ncbi:MAG TPA: response regulator, partial [Candidatus Binataceae bacterium]
RVGVTSTPGKGSIFSAILPRIDHAHLAEVVPPSTRAPRAGALSVLVIEDAPRDREWLVNTLEGAGYGVESAATGAEALRLLNQRPFDAITLDLMLPDMSGWDVLRQARAGEINRSVPVMVVTVLADEGSGVGFAIHDFLEKPVEEGDLLAALDRARMQGATKGTTILLVDNNRRELKLYQAALEQNGYTTVAKSNAAAALRVAAENPPDVVVLDLVMPQMDGFEFLRRFRAAEHGRRTPVIVLTAKDLVREHQELLTAMAEGIVAKGDGSVRTLLAEIGTALAHSGAIPEIAAAANGGSFEPGR